MESVELKLRLIDNAQFPVALTKKMAEILHEPEMSIEVKDGQITEEVSRTLDSLGYVITARRQMEGWMTLKAVKQKKE